MTAPGAAPTEQAIDFSDHQGVWVYVQHRGGVAASVSWQLLGVGKQMAIEIDAPVCAVVIGSAVDHLVEEATAYGADRVYLVDDPVLAHYRTQPYAEAIASLIRKYKPEIMLYGSTIHGRDVAGAVATLVGTGLAADATQLSVDPQQGNLLQASRPDFGGKLMSTILCKRHRPQMATCRPGVFPLPTRDPERGGEVIKEPLGLAEEDVPTRVLEFVPETHHVDLSNAEVIVSGGRGLGGPKAFDMLFELADAVGGVVGASRAAVMAGWIPYQHQVGQTGQTVRPRVYIACGISGAIQHLVGMQESDVIIAINSDPDAQIFKNADFAVVGDMFKIVPALTERLRRMQRSETNGQGEVPGHGASEAQAAPSEPEPTARTALQESERG
jgi:electron transfer flavoprotein alpha subunit